MQILRHYRQRFIWIGRSIMWAAIGLLFAVGVFSHAPAWAETAQCIENPTSGNSSIPISPTLLFLRYGGPASTYTVELCGDPDPGDEVDFTTTVTPSNVVSVSPTAFTLDDTEPQVVSVSVLGTHPADVPFTALITVTSSSNNPGFDGVVTPITAYYSPPVAVDDQADTMHGQSIIVPVVANDVDRLGQGIELPAGATFAPTSGTAVRQSDETIRYTPAPAFSGLVTFTYPLVDAIGNTDVGEVSIYVAPAGVENYEVAVIDPDEGRQILLSTSFGTVELDIPEMTGVQDGATVLCVVYEVEDPEGDTTSPPGGVGTFTGLAIFYQCYVNGVEVDASILSEPATVTINLPVPTPVIFVGSDLLVVKWDGDEWQTEGIDLLETTGPTIRFTTTNFGEFVVFAVWNLHLPVLARQPVE